MWQMSSTLLTAGRKHDAGRFQTLALFDTFRHSIIQYSLFYHDSGNSSLLPKEGMMGAPRRYVIPYLRAWRLHRLMTHAQLARAAGVGKTTVIRLAVLTGCTTTSLPSMNRAGRITKCDRSEPWSAIGIWTYWITPSVC